MAKSHILRHRSPSRSTGNLFIATFLFLSLPARGLVWSKLRTWKQHSSVDLHGWAICLYLAFTLCLRVGLTWLVIFFSCPAFRTLVFHQWAVSFAAKIKKKTLFYCCEELNPTKLRSISTYLWWLLLFKCRYIYSPLLQPAIIWTAVAFASAFKYRSSLLGVSCLFRKYKVRTSEGKVSNPAQQLGKCISFRLALWLCTWPQDYKL